MNTVSKEKLVNHSLKKDFGMYSSIRPIPEIIDPNIDAVPFTNNLQITNQKNQS